ncbi:MAG: hypothetical protein IIB90_14620, partial [Gemmatimonadetes bacterium]|nr:hypothetical protein [Gemmatimonadota bacterium]
MTVKILGPVFWVFAAFACAGGSGTGAPTSSVRPADEKEEISVEVQNQNFYQATVYAYRAGSRTRLGVVESQGTRSFEFVWITGDLRFLVDFFANGCILTEPLAVDRGDDLLLILEP